MSATSIVVMVFSILVGTVILQIVIKLFLRWIQGKNMSGAVQDLANENVLSITSNANFFGQKSKGMSQIRGNGVWAMTRDRIYFRLAVPNRTLSIPLESITGTHKAKKFLGKLIVGVSLLVVEFTNEGGRPDACAWAISEADQRKALIDSALVGKRPA